MSSPNRSRFLVLLPIFSVRHFFRTSVATSATKNRKFEIAIAALFLGLSVVSCFGEILFELFRILFTPFSSFSFTFSIFSLTLSSFLFPFLSYSLYFSLPPVCLFRSCFFQILRYWNRFLFMWMNKKSFLFHSLFCDSGIYSSWNVETCLHWFWNILFGKTRKKIQIVHNELTNCVFSIIPVSQQ